MKILDIIGILESVAPSAYQEGYDNSGLIVGQINAEVSGVLVCLDCIESVVDEAILKGFNLIIAHHPIVFKGLKRLNGKNYVERVVMKAIKHDINIYAIHTNLDSVLYKGVNTKFAEKLGLINTKILAPKGEILRKLYTFVPSHAADAVRKALFEAGAGHIGNYSSCSYNTEGFGTFLAEENANPFVGEKGKIHKEKEEKIEVVYLSHQENAIIKALLQTHPYEEVAYDIIKLENAHNTVGAGMIGELSSAMPTMDFLQMLKNKMKAGCVKYTKPHVEEIKTVAICGGSGSFLLRDAMAQKADIFITADYTYHLFFDAESKIIIADIGHYESEQYTIELIMEILAERFVDLPMHGTSVNTNPVLYL